VQPEDDLEETSTFTGYGTRPRVEDLFAKGPSGGTQSPISPGAGMSGPYRQPGNFKGRTVEGTPGRSGLRTITVPGNLLAGHDNSRPGNGDRTNPPDFIADVDIDGNFFSPFQPVYPFGPPNVNYPRTFDYPVGINLDIYPRRLAVMGMLRTLASASGVIASVLESRIDELVALSWKFQLKDSGMGVKSEDDPRIKDMTEFFKRPDRKTPYAMWMRSIYRDRYTIDAASAFVWKNKLGTKPYAIMALDGATIKPLVDDYGRIPDAPNPGYQQIIKGLPMNNFTEDELLYMPARPRTDFPIGGYSEIEQIMNEAIQMVKKSVYMTNFWTEGTIPDVMLGVPETWSPEQIAIWQASFDALMSGNLNKKSKIRFIPGGMEPFEMKGSAGELLKSEYDEWLTRIVCHAFRTLPKPFVKEPQSRASAEQEKEQIEEQGIQVEMIWWKAFMDRLITMGWGYTDIEFVFSYDDEVAATDQATIDNLYLRAGRETINEQRERSGQDPIVGGDVAMVYTGTGAMPLSVLAAQTALPTPAGAGGGDDSGSGKGAGKVADAPFTKAQRRWRRY
jgi:hypothetical protein